MKIPVTVNWKKLSISLVLIVLAFGSYTAYRTFATPSGQTWSVEGGGFCAGDFLFYNNTVDNLIYAQQCSTGVNVVTASSDMGAAFNTVVNTYGGSARSLAIYWRNGFYAVVTSMVLPFSGFRLVGAGMGNYVTDTGPYSASTPPTGTVLVAKTNAMTMLKNTAGTPTYTGTTSGGCTPAVIDTTIDGFFFFANALAAIGIDFEQCELSSNNNFLHLMMNGEFICSNPPTCSTTASIKGFSTAAMIVGGSQISYLDDSFFDGNGIYPGSPSTWGNAVDVIWKDQVGSSWFNNDKFAGQVALELCSERVTVYGSTVDTPVRFLGSGTTGCPNLGAAGYVFDSDWIFGSTGITNAYMMFVEASQTITSVVVENSLTGPGSNNYNWFPSGSAGTISMFSMCHNAVNFGSTITWNAGTTTVTNYKSCGDNMVQSGSTPTGFPYTITSGVF